MSKIYILSCIAAIGFFTGVAIGRPHEVRADASYDIRYNTNLIVSELKAQTQILKEIAREARTCR